MGFLKDDPYRQVTEQEAFAITVTKNAIRVFKFFLTEAGMDQQAAEHMTLMYVLDHVAQMDKQAKAHMVKLNDPVLRDKAMEITEQISLLKQMVQEMQTKTKGDQDAKKDN